MAKRAFAQVHLWDQLCPFLGWSSSDSHSSPSYLMIGLMYAVQMELPLKTIWKIHMIQNAVAQTATGVLSYMYVTQMLPGCCLASGLNSRCWLSTLRPSRHRPGWGLLSTIVSVYLLGSLRMGLFWVSPFKEYHLGGIRKHTSSVAIPPFWNDLPSRDFRKICSHH